MNDALTVPTIPHRTCIPQLAIQSVVDQIALNFRPQKIVLFGSYAYGTPLPESDVDLLVIMETQLTSAEQASQICRKIQYRFGLDLIVCTPIYLTHRLELGDSFFREITRNGITYYEAPHD
jgi:predicted nucleotidyltransferase